MTTDHNGFIVDSSIVAGMALSVTVSGWTTFATASASRADSYTTIRTTSVGVIDFTLNIPIDAGCRI